VEKYYYASSNEIENGKISGIKASKTLVSMQFGKIAFAISRNLFYSVAYSEARYLLLI